MKLSKLKREIKGVFKPPVKYYYIGEAKYGTPYFDPINYVGSIIKVRKLNKRSPEEIEEKNKKYPHLKNTLGNNYTNYPMVRRSKNKIFKLFGNDYYVTWGWPWAVKFTELGWKDKWESPRYEWSPQFHILFFGLQFCIWWRAPMVEGEKYPNNDKYYEMILWYLNYADKDIKKAEKTWPWTNFETKKSSWNKKYLK